MNGHQRTGLALLAAAVLGAVFYWCWSQAAPRRQSLNCLRRLEAAIHSANHGELLDLVVIPASIQSHPQAEQVELLAKALNDEISPEGVAVLSRRGVFGPLKEIFPAEADAWTQRAGANPNDCLAFKFERNGLRCEVVLVKSEAATPASSRDIVSYRILRANNVRQMAESRLPTRETM